MDLEIDRIVHAEPRSAHSPAHQARLVVAPHDFAATSPFLLMAEDWFSPPAGFPDHPHRGIQTVTIVLEGGLEHRDHTGARGVLGAGDIQWMTAGRGVIHSEMPAPGGVHSLQLWLNLPAERKMTAPLQRPACARHAGAPRRGLRGARVRRAVRRDRAAAREPLAAHALDVRVEGERRVELPVPAGWRAFLYVSRGPRAHRGRRHAVTDQDVVWFKPRRPASDPATWGWRRTSACARSSSPRRSSTSRSWRTGPSS
jgi:redox-sensitive bicupin YhaK (pirin superfamily)